jgi:hypothetical protein
MHARTQPQHARTHSLSTHAWAHTLKHTHTQKKKKKKKDVRGNKNMTIALFKEKKKKLFLFSSLFSRAAPSLVFI